LTIPRPLDTSDKRVGNSRYGGFVPLSIPDSLDLTPAVTALCTIRGNLPPAPGIARQLDRPRAVSIVLSVYCALHHSLSLINALR
jgi:hypothetical protein